MTNPSRFVLVSVLLLLAAPRFARADESATLEVTLSVSGAKLELDDVVVAPEAGQSFTRPVAPGLHMLRASKDGFQPVVRRVEAAAGTTATVEVVLSPLESGSNKALTRIALQQVALSGEVDARLAQVVTESLLAELRKLEKTSVLGMNEVNEMLSFEQQRQLLGCEESSCLAEIAGSLGVDQLVTASISVIGGSTMFSLRRTDLTRARVLGSVARRLTMVTGEELLSEIGPSVQELFPEFVLRAGRKRGASIEAARRLNPPPIPRWAFFAGVGATLLAAGFAGYSGVQFSNAQSEYQALAALSTSQVVPGGELMEAGMHAQSLAQQVNVALGLTAGLALLTGVGGLFTNFWEEPTTPVAVLVPTADGASLAVAGRF